MGVIHVVSASIHAIGSGLAVARSLKAKHAIKQVDRLLSNSALNVWALFVEWVPHVLATQREIVVALDWTEFDADGDATVGLYLVTRHGRATPLIWQTAAGEPPVRHAGAHGRDGQRLLAGSGLRRDPLLP